MACLPSKNPSMEIPLKMPQREDVCRPDKPVVGEEFLVRFLQKYEIEEDIKMLLEMPANGEIGMAGTKDVASPAASQELDFYELSDMKLDDQEGGNTSLVCERGQDGTWEPRAEKKLRKTRHQARKTGLQRHKKKRKFLKMLREAMEEVKNCEQLVSHMLHDLK